MKDFNPIAAIKQLRAVLFTCRKTLRPSKNKKFEVNRLALHAFNRRFARILIKDLREYKKYDPEFYSKVVDPKTFTL
jgi:hypothetical protein